MSIPPPPPGFALDGVSPQPRETKAATASQPPTWFAVDAAPPRIKKVVPPQVMEPVDGDTLRLPSSQLLRVWGIDAPERGQQGWNRKGSPVPIGQASLDTIATALANRIARAGPSQGESYGRVVAPVAIENMDLGQSMLRGGNALAAPGFLSADPDRRFAYLQAERLARLNGLGMHDTYHKTPQDYRTNPVDAPARETVAQFWDTPTPLAGMRPDVEKRFVAMLNDYAISPQDVAAFARDNGGFVVDPEEIRTKRERAGKSGQSIGMNYSEAPKPLTDLGDGATGAAVRGVGSGVLASGLDEAGAFADMVGLTPGRENIWNSDRRLADIWSNNQQQNSSILGYDDYAHPYATLGGEIAGGLLVPFGAKARTVPQLFRVGAAYGGAGGFLGTDGDIGERAKGAAVGVPVGGAIGAGAGKTIELLSPQVRRLVERFTGKPVLAAPESVSYIPGNIPPPPDGFALDESPRAIAMDAEPMDRITARQRDYLDMGRPQRLDQPVSDAQMQAITANISPADVLPIPSNVVADVEEAAARDAGRYLPARPANERDELTRRTVRAWNGAEVPKVGPIDLVGWTRLNGGLADQGGELSHIGMTNAARKGMDFVGQEQRFGPLVNQTGMTLDDAALRAWEEGYFPDHPDRPTTSEFLDALRDTHEGRNRRFLPEDMGEIDRFQGVQADRLDLEQRLAEGPVYHDQSVPAEEPQPSLPAEAYEEWPAGGPDFAGNINLSKLESPQDISRALVQTEKRVGFDAAIRGRVTQAETERLAAHLGMTPESLMARRKGQAFNAEEALAARQILAKSGNELVNAAKKIRVLEEPGDELLADFRQKWMRHVAIQEQVAGATAEAGRALSQFRMAADSRAVRGDVLAALVRGGGGRDNLKDAADALIDAAETSPGVFNAVAEKLTKAKWQSRASELYINFLLSGPQTHVVNMASNTLTGMAQIPEHATAALIGKARQMFTNGEINRIVGSEVGARAFGLLQGAREGARLFAQALRTGEASDFVAKVEGEEYKAIPGKLGEVIRIPTRLLTAEDELFKGIARRMELNGQAVRIARREGLKGDAAKQRISELVADPTDEMLERALDYGRYLTFQRKLGPFAQDVSNAANRHLIAKVFLPFVRTPTNLLKFATERSPAAPLLREWRTDFKAGGERRDLAIARMMLGTGFGMSIYEAAESGLVTGSAPTDPKKARLLYADGWKPYSIRIGDKWYSYKRLDPFSTTLGVAADMATLPEGMSERQKDEAATLLVASIMGNLASKTWLSGISDVVSALHEPGRYAENLLQRLVGSFLVPSGVAQVARTVDPVARQTDSVGEYVQSRIPGLSDDLLPRRDIWGREIVNEGGVGPDIASPVWTSTQMNDPVNSELMQLDYAPGYPDRKVGGRELTPQEYDRYVEIAGKLSHQRLTNLVTSPAWRSLDDDARVDVAEKIVRDARRDARSQLFEVGEGEKSPRGSHDVLPPLPPGFEIEGESGGRNVFKDLQRAIPGIRFTSGYRDEAYQADMRKRGYKPARNSGHLDGSSFDILPPPGKSMGWLQKQIGQYDRTAQVLPEGDHMHVTFPGYYGAPAIGGAKGAGLKNPLAGMPPPPAGFRLDGQ